MLHAVYTKLRKSQKVKYSYLTHGRTIGSPENAGLENGGPKKSRGWKMQDRKMTDNRVTPKPKRRKQHLVYDNVKKLLLPFYKI